MSCCKEIKLIQGTPEWLIWRKEHLCATDTAKILDRNPWSSPLDCYNEKIEDKSTFVTPAMQRGKDLEPIARQNLMATYGINLEPKVFESTEHPFMGASLDAINATNDKLYEIKCVGENTMKRALNGKIDDMYIIQCNKQMLVMGLQSMHLFYYYNEYLNHSIEITRNDEIIKAIIEKETYFWNEHILKQIPPEKYGIDYERIDDDKANELALQWLEYNTIEKKAKETKDMIAKHLSKFSRSKNCIFPEAKLKHQYIERKGSIDWPKVCVKWEINNAELEEFRKDKSGYSKFSEM